MVAYITHSEVFDAAFIGAVGAVIAAGVSAVALVTARRNTGRIQTNRETGDYLKASIDLLVDGQHQHGERLDHIADRADEAKENMVLVRAQAALLASAVDEVMARVRALEVSALNHVDKYEAVLEFVRTLMPQEGGNDGK